MPNFQVTVSRSFTSRHVHERVVEAPDAKTAKAWVEQELDNDEFDPTDNYVEQATGYDDAGSWSVDDHVAVTQDEADTTAGEVDDGEEGEAGPGYTNQG